MQLQGCEDSQSTEREALPSPYPPVTRKHLTLHIVCGFGSVAQLCVSHRHINLSNVLAKDL